jgi:endonuclease/exonuclease/phosphatase (EEP) superfamily protein YafD
MGDCNMVGAPVLNGFADVGPRHATHKSGRLIPLRLDRCFIRGLQCSASQTLEKSASDHRPIMVVIEV